VVVVPSRETVDGLAVDNLLGVVLVEPNHVERVVLQVLGGVVLALSVECVDAVGDKTEKTVLGFCHRIAAC
jgi:hypothetical protein